MHMNTKYPLIWRNVQSCAELPNFSMEYWAFVHMISQKKVCNYSHMPTSNYIKHCTNQCLIISSRITQCTAGEGGDQDKQTYNKDWRWSSHGTWNNKISLNIKSQFARKWKWGKLKKLIAFKLTLRIREGVCTQKVWGHVAFYRKKIPMEGLLSLRVLNDRQTDRHKHTQDRFHHLHCWWGNDSGLAELLCTKVVYFTFAACAPHSSVVIHGMMVITPHDI